MPQRNLTIRTRDGLHLAGSLVTPDRAANRVVVLAHGSGVTREEGGFFTRLATGLNEAGAASLRFDLRGHGASEGRQEELTLAGLLSDITAALALVAEEVVAGGLSLVGTGLSGGICGYYASRHPGRLTSLVLLNPLLNYKKRFIDDKPYWHGEKIDDEMGRALATNGFIAHSPTFKLGRPLLNEVFYFELNRALVQVTTPTLLIHGSADTFTPVESSRAASTYLAGESKFIELDGAEHGFAAPHDPFYQDPRTRQWQAFVIESIAQWVTSH